MFIYLHCIEYVVKAKISFTFIKNTSYPDIFCYNQVYPFKFERETEITANFIS